MDTIKLGVLGSGQMGSGIAQIAAAHGCLVTLRDINQELCDKAIERMRTALAARTAKGKLTEEEAARIIGSIRTTTELSDLRECACVIEAVPEDLVLKRSVFAQLGEVCRPDALLCTNTSSMSITEITESCTHPERCCGMHFFFPVAQMKLVELIRSNFTSDATLENAKQLATRLGKTAVLCNTDTAGFIVNRCLFAMMLEALRCYEDGVASPEDIDTAMRLGLNHPLGPFELMDLSGLDTFPHVTEQLERLPVTGWRCPDSVAERILLGRLGRKSGGGWYDYR